jgi:UDP-N-acetylmuramoyl-L-alanyl-D-glutamate--2,6-diaminopimelate ligase
MQLSAALSDVDVVALSGDPRTEIHAVTRDSRAVVPGVAFVAITGAQVDGHRLVAGLPAGSVAIVERWVEAPGIVVVRVRDTRRALGRVAAALYGHPSRAMAVVGVTGTKGKTTTTTLLEQALLAAGWPAGVIGTVGSRSAGVAIESQLTTPEAPEFQALLARMRDDGCRVVGIEASSIGLAQRRLQGTTFHCGVFTNLGTDHLDFHGTVDDYVAAKALLFEEHLRPAGGFPRAVLNADDPVSDRLGAPDDRWTFGFGRSDLQLRDLRSDASGTAFMVDTPLGAAEVRSPLVGRHNAYNLAAALGAALCCGVPLADAVEGLSQSPGAPGRLEIIPNLEGLLVAVDYAHTPESLEAILIAVRECGPKRLFVVFGCGGDRDAGKRPLMGAVAERLADVVVLTSDNPRSEDPGVILADIAGGCSRPPALREPDRAAAIQWAIAEASPGDAVLIAGKGHEPYQEVGGHRLPFDDRQVAAAALAARAPRA